MRDCRDRYGDRFTVSLSQRLPPVVFFSNPQALQVIMTSDDSELFDSPGAPKHAIRTFSGNAIPDGIER